MARACPDGLQAGFGLGGDYRNAICLIKSDFGYQPDGLKLMVTGTGFHIANRRQSSFVATAAHNIYNHDLKRFARRIDCWFARNGGVASASREAQEVFVGEAYTAAAVPEAAHDFGLLRVSGLGTDRFPGIQMRESRAPTIFDARLIGYPDEDACYGRFAPYYADVLLGSQGNDGFDYPAGQASYRGMSGGPLTGRDSVSGPVLAYGLHIRGPNDSEVRAVRFSPRVTSFYRRWLDP